MHDLHLPMQPFCNIQCHVFSDDDMLTCIEHKMSSIDDTPEVEGDFIIHIATNTSYEFTEYKLKDSNFREAKKRYKELYQLFLQEGYLTPKQ